MPSEGFCPRCGRRRSTAASSGVDGLCPRCHLSVIDPLEVPTQLALTRCGTCGAIKEGERWVDADADADLVDLATAAVADAVAVHRSIDVDDWGIVAQDPSSDQIRTEVRLSGTTRSERLTATANATVTIATGQCDRCGRIAGGYFASLLQVRATDRVPTEGELKTAEETASAYIRSRIDVGDRNAFISDVRRTKDGLDIKLSTNQIGGAIAKQITDHLGGKVRSHPTLVTEDGDGNAVYRVTYTVRLPQFTAGDIIEPEGTTAPVVITNLGEHITGLQLGPYTPVYLGTDETDGLRRLGDLDDVVETTIVAPAGDHEVQVLHPETLATVTVRRIPHSEPDDGSVGVFVDGDRVWPVPADPAASVRRLRQDA
jgi:NMD protein affecting ribosome stability and mRNA decay